jgi:hypothetical protein
MQNIALSPAQFDLTVFTKFSNAFQQIISLFRFNVNETAIGTFDVNGVIFEI